MVHKDGERLYQKALKTKNAEKEIKLLEQAWELGCLKAGPDLGFYLQTEDEDIDCGSEDFQEEAIRNNVRAYRMMKQALDGGVTDAIGGLKWLTSNIDFTNRKRYGELSSEDPRYFSSQYWEEQELLTDNKTAQLLYGLHLEKTNPIAACWWLTRAAEPGSIERSNALRDIESIKGSNEELPPEARLILNYDLIPLTWPDVLEEPKNSGYNREELRRYYRTAPGQAAEEDCAVFQEGLRAYYGKGAPLSYAKALECFKKLWGKGYKKLGTIVRELEVASADEREKVFLQKLHSEEMDKFRDELRNLRERAVQDSDPHSMYVANRFSDMIMHSLKNFPEYWTLQTDLAREGDLFRVDRLIAHYSVGPSRNEEMAEVWNKQKEIFMDRYCAQTNHNDMAAFYALASYYIRWIGLGALTDDPENRRKYTDEAKRLLRHAILLGSGPAQVLLDQLED